MSRATVDPSLDHGEPTQMTDLDYRVDLALLELENLKRELKELAKKVKMDVPLLLLERAEVAVKGIREDT